MNITTIIAAGGLVRNEADDLLMIYRRGKWDLPKGKLDEGETIEACAIREVKEETGLNEITLGKLIGITHHRYFDKWIMNDVIKETHWFEMKVKDHPVFIPQKEEDILEIRWVNKKDLPEYLQETYPNIIEIVRKAINQ
jgi:8-oxo-dGTP pyrophosphatase MutT (NUDIX family)